MSTVVSFADWLQNYSSHTYKDTTADKYEAALEKGPNWLGITLKKAHHGAFDNRRVQSSVRNDCKS